ncbi:Kelch-like protein 24 [Sparganum proliferum]
MLGPRASASVISLPDGRVFVIGGFNEHEVLDSVEFCLPTEDAYEVDEITGFWKVATPMPSPRYGQAAVTIDGKIIVAGGVFGCMEKTVRMFTPPNSLTSTGQWTTLNSMRQCRYCFSLVATANKIFAFANVISTNGNSKVENGETAHLKLSGVDAIKRFWRISQTPINNPLETYPLEKIPSLLTSDDIHMADADSVSEATSKDLPLSKQGWTSSSHRVADKSDEDTVATNSINPFSASESSSLSSSPVTGQIEDSLALRVSPFGLCTHDVPPKQELTSHGTSAETTPTEMEAVAVVDEAGEEEESGVLDASLRNAEMQATLEAFKARHPTLPLVKTDAWRQDLCRLTPSLLQRYYDELMTETGRVSEQLVASLAEREELILFREVEDDFVVLHNAIQVRRRRAAEAVLAKTTQSVLFNKKSTQLTTVRRLPGDPQTGSLIELVNLPPDLVRNGIGSSADNMLRPRTEYALDESRNINNSTRASSRCPRGHPVGEPINLPSLRSALSRLGSRLGYRSVSTSHLTADRSIGDVRGKSDQQFYETGNTPGDCHSSEMMQFIQSARSRRGGGGRKHAVTLPSPYLPWPLGRPECSQALRLTILVPTEDLNTWLAPRLHIINRILQAALLENQSISSLFEELSTYDSTKSSDPTSKLVEYGFEAPNAHLSASLLACNKPERTHSRKNVTFDWRGTKEPFNMIAAKSTTSVSATQSDNAF